MLRGTGGSYDHIRTGDVLRLSGKDDGAPRLGLFPGSQYWLICLRLGRHGIVVTSRQECRSKAMSVHACFAGLQDLHFTFCGPALLRLRGYR